MSINIIIFIISAFVISVSLAADLTNAEKTIVENSVKSELKDPESARFKSLPIPDGAKGEFKTENISAITYCGLVNSKNSFGGYSGDVPYSVFLVRQEDSSAISAVLSIGSADWGSPSSRAILETCGDAGYTNFSLAK